MQELRSSLGPDKLLSVAVPSQEVDLIAFTESTMPRISEIVDFINVMAYELMNRRNTEIIHATGVAGSKAAVQRYIDRGTPAHKINLGLPYYLKWYLTQPDCDPEHPLGCPTQLMEDPATGDDLGRTGGFSWHDETPPELVESFSRARNHGFYDVDGSYGYWDQEESRWWSYDTPKSIKTKMAEVVGGLGLGGAFAWGLGEDAPGFEHLIATAEGIKALGEQNAVRDEL
jgi:GH18 family chitinase